MRLFVSIIPPDEVIKELGRIQKQLPAFEGTDVRPENLHCTLAFLGSVDDSTIPEIISAFETIVYPSFTLRLNAVELNSPPKTSCHLGLLRCSPHNTTCSPAQYLIQPYRDPALFRPHYDRPYKKSTQDRISNTPYSAHRRTSLLASNSSVPASIKYAARGSRLYNYRNSQISVIFKTNSNLLVEARLGIH